MTPCRECQGEVSEQASACPHCGAPFPARAQWDGWGWEYKSRLKLAGIPFVHISFKYRPNRMPVPARGIIAIGQFGVGLITIAQFGVGLFCLSQFALGGFVLAQFALAYSCIAQIGLYVDQGVGQVVWKLAELLTGP